MLTMEMIKDSTISEKTFSEMSLIIKNKPLFECNECELLEIMLELITDKILIDIMAQESTIDYLEDLATGADYYLFQESINKCSLKAAVLKEVRNMINEL